jgi:hypothetical protein
MGREWRLTVAPLDHVVLLTPGSGALGDEVELLAEPQMAILPALVAQLFPVTETKSGLLRALTRSLAGVQCHRLSVGDPAAMSRALTTNLG